MWVADEMRIFKTRSFARFSRKEGIEDADLYEAVERASKGLIDADLGGGVIKQRIARAGQGRSGGYRSIILLRIQHRAVFVHGFAKNDRANIRDDEERAFRMLAPHILGATDEVLKAMVQAGDLVEI